MIKRDVLIGPSCLTAANEDEPLFVLRANDELAPIIVRSWAYAYRRDKRERGEYTLERMKKFEDAMACASAMEQWKHSQA